jgi:mutator protein MutT
LKRGQVALGLIRRQGRFFLQRRAPGASAFPALWEFPGGKVEPGETPREALLRELQEEVQCAPERVTALPTLRHAYPGLEVELHPFLCAGGTAPATELAWGWFTLAELAALPMLEANRGLLEKLSGMP